VTSDDLEAHHGEELVELDRVRVGILDELEAVSAYWVIGVDLWSGSVVRVGTHNFLLEYGGSKSQT
jgi:hypothetical protein